MKLRRCTPAFNQDDGKFRRRMQRHEVAELLANGEANLQCDRCGTGETEGTCFTGDGHDWILLLRPVSFDHKGPSTLFTHAETAAYAGAHGYIAKSRARAKFKEMYGTETRLS